MMENKIKHNLIGISGKINSGKDTVGEIIRILTYCKLQENTPFCKTPEILCNKVIKGEARIGDSEHTYEIKKFADKLKDIVCLLIGCDRDQLEDRVFKEKELREEWRKWFITYKKVRNFSMGRNGENYDNENKFFNTEQEAQTHVEWVYKNFDHHERIGFEVYSELLTPRKLLQLLGTECGREIIHPNIWVNALFSRFITPPEENSLTQYYPSRWIITDVRFENEAKAIKDKGGILIRINRPINTKDDTILSTALAMRAANPEHPSETGLDSYEDWDHVIHNDGTIDELIQQIKQLNII